MMKASGFLAIAALLMVPPAAAAQLDRPTSPHAVFEMAERQDWVLRVTAVDGSTVEGRVREVDEASVRLEGGRVQLADAARVERGERVGGGGRRGAILGAIGGGLAFAALLFTIPGGVGDGALLIPAIGAGLGAVVGGLMGAAFDPSEMEWRTVWPAGR